MEYVIATRTLEEIAHKPDKPYEIRDSEQHGLLLRIHPTGTAAYVVQYARGRRLTLGKVPALSLDRARAQAKAKLELFREHGIDPQDKRRQERDRRKQEREQRRELRQRLELEQKSDLPFSQFLERHYKPWLRVHNKRYAAEEIDRLERLFPEVYCPDKGVDLPLSRITPAVIESWRTRRLKEGVKRCTLNRQLTAFKTAINRAVTIWELLPASPIAKVRLSQDDTDSRVRFLSKDERQRLFEALDEREKTLRRKRAYMNDWLLERGKRPKPCLDNVPFADYLKPMVRLSLATGLRRGELFSLVWGDISFTQRLLTVRSAAAKNKRERKIPLNDTAYGVLKQWWSQRRTPNRRVYVFPSPRGGRQNEGPRKPFVEVLKAAGIRGFRWHDLRHCFASALVQNRVELNRVRALLGHRDLKMTLRYAHLADEQLADAVALIEE